MLPELLNIKKLKTRTVITILLLLGISFLGFRNYLFFHSAVELYTIVIFFCITILASNAYSIAPENIDPFYDFMGVASFFIGVFHVIHALAYKGMGVFPGATANLPTQLYIISRYMLSLSLLGASIFAAKKLKSGLLVLIYSCLTVILLLSVFYWGIFPDCYVEGQGLTIFKISSEYVIGIIFLVVVAYLYLKRDNFHPMVLRHTYNAIAFAIAGELMFTLYIGVYDYFNMLGHLLHVISALYLYRGLVKTCFADPITALFSELSEKNEELESQTLELQRINNRLEQEIEEKSQIQRELTTSKNLYQGLFHNLLDGFSYNKLIYDKNGVAVDYVFLEVNEAFAKFYGWKRNDMIGKRATEVFPDEAQVWIPLFEKVAKEGTNIRVKHHFTEKNKWITITSFSPETNYFVTIVTDVTDLKRSWETNLA